MITVYSSHGEIALSDQGRVLAKHRYDNSDKESAFIDDILHFDSADLTGADAFDILNLGYWYIKGAGIAYEPKRQPELPL